MSRRIIIDELDFEVPYGKLAAKTWHEETKESKRFLILHGWMDNAGSFDNLMPLIKHKDGAYIVALDLPGHGRSSQLPAGSSYSDLSILMEIRRCLTDMNWTQSSSRGDIDTASNITNQTNNDGETKKKFSIIGHSLGGGLGLWYASLYPGDVDEVIVLDFLKVKTPPVDQLLKETAASIDAFIELVPSRSPFPSPISKPTMSTSGGTGKNVDKGQVVVSQEAAIVATIDAHKQLGALTRDDAACLLKRSTVAVSSPPNSVIYSRDLRLQAMLNFRENMDVFKVMFSNIKCNILFILGKRGMYAENELFRDRMDEVEAFYKKRAKSSHVQWVEGDHYLHMSMSNKVAEIINKFLESPEAYQVVS